MIKTACYFQYRPPLKTTENTGAPTRTDTRNGTGKRRKVVKKQGSCISSAENMPLNNKTSSPLSNDNSSFNNKTLSNSNKKSGSANNVASPASKKTPSRSNGAAVLERSVDQLKRTSGRKVKELVESRYNTMFNYFRGVSAVRSLAP